MNQDSIHMTAPARVYASRRARLASSLTRPLVVFAGRARARQYATNVHPFRAGSSYLYFGGSPLEGAAWLIEPGSDGDNGCTLFRSVGSVEDTVWTGPSVPDDAIAQAAGMGTSRLALPEELAGRLSGRVGAYVAPPCPATMDRIASIKLQPANPDELLAIINMRLIKDEHELRAMRRAADVAVQAHLAAMKATAPGQTEAKVAAALTSVLVSNNCDHSFTPIVTVHGEVLHCDGYRHDLTAGKLLLVDAGAEERGGYASDITRAYPVDGTFTPIQRQLHDTVLRAQRQAIAACVPGRRYRDIHDLAARIICEGLVEAELLRGDATELASRGAHTLFFTHGVGHLLGLDVHDMEDFGDLAGYAPGRSRRTEFGSKYLRLDRDLKPGMTVTIEPGIYLVPAVWRQNELLRPFEDAINRPAIEALLKNHFGGIRIEDDVHVRTADAAGPEVLTAALPSDADAVAAIVGGPSR